MKLEKFSIRDNHLVGFGTGTGTREYAVHFDIETWKETWEKEGISIEDFLNERAYIETNVRNRPRQKTKFVKRGPSDD